MSESHVKDIIVEHRSILNLSFTNRTLVNLRVVVFSFSTWPGFSFDGHDKLSSGVLVLRPLYRMYAAASTVPVENRLVPANVLLTCPE